MSAVTPIRTMGNLPEHGRIRTGVKSGRAMKALETFRFTSVDRNALEQLATQYGGSVRVWEDPRANPPSQFELISEASVIEVAIQPDSVDLGYELWSAGGLTRRCDGETMTTWVRQRDDQVRQEQPCVCHGQGVLECQLKTRVSVLFPGIHFAGTWRYESAGKTVANTVPGMLAIIDALQSASGLLPVEMAIVPQERMRHGQKQKYSIVQFRTKVTVDQMLGGSGTYQAQVGSGTTVMAPALPSAPTVDNVPDEIPAPGAVYSHHDDDEIAEAELVDEEDEVGVNESTAADHPDSYPTATVTPIEQARQALRPNDGWPKTFKTKGEALACAREHPGKVIKKDGTGWAVH